jgi:hypothetical protein
MRDLLAGYTRLLTRADLLEVERLSLDALRARQGGWALEDASRAWCEGLLVVLARKGYLRPLAQLEAEARALVQPTSSEACRACSCAKSSS